MDTGSQTWCSGAGHGGVQVWGVPIGPVRDGLLENSFVSVRCHNTHPVTFTANGRSILPPGGGAPPHAVMPRPVILSPQSLWSPYSAPELVCHTHVAVYSTLFICIVCLGKPATSQLIVKFVMPWPPNSVWPVPPLKGGLDDTGIKGDAVTVMFDTVCVAGRLNQKTAPAGGEKRMPVTPIGWSTCDAYAWSLRWPTITPTITVESVIMPAKIIAYIRARCLVKLPPPPMVIIDYVNINFACHIVLFVTQMTIFVKRNLLNSSSSLDFLIYAGPWLRFDGYAHA